MVTPPSTSAVIANVFVRDCADAIALGSPGYVASSPLRLLRAESASPPITPVAIAAAPVPATAIQFTTGIPGGGGGGGGGSLVAAPILASSSVTAVSAVPATSTI